MKKPRLTTVTFADGSVARRTSERYSYTHAVTASREDPVLVKAHLEAAARNAAADIEALRAAAAAGPAIRSRGFGSPGTDMFLGKPSWVMFEAFLDYQPATARSRPFMWCNSKGITASLVPAADLLRSRAEQQIKDLESDIVSACRSLAALEDGSYVLGAPMVLSWSSSERLAEKALRAAGPYPTRVLSIVPVDSENPMLRGVPEEG